MAELLSVQVHAPVTLTSVNVTSPAAAGHSPGTTGASAAAVSVPVEMEHLKADCGGARRLKKVDNATQDAAVTGTAGSSGAGTRFDYLPKRHTVNIEFDQLTYTVSEGRKKGYTISSYLAHFELMVQGCNKTFIWGDRAEGVFSLSFPSFSFSSLFLA